MTARDDYPHLANDATWYVGITNAERERGAALDEIDRLRAEKAELWCEVLKLRDGMAELDGLLAECGEWFNHVEQLGYDRIDPTLRAAIAKAVGR